jgi:catechol 2,3-dioxygenase-like lactoylglutathione lyase family enzyme
MRLTVNLFCRNHEACFSFYQALLGGAEIESQRSTIFCSLSFGGFELGFHAPEAVTLLEAAPWQAAGTSPAQPGAAHYPNFDVDTAAAVNAAADQAVALGGRVVKGPYATYYGAWQVVLADPEGHFFRINCPNAGR